MKEEYLIRITDDSLSITRRINMEQGNNVYGLGYIDPSQWDFVLAKGLATIFREVTTTQFEEFKQHWNNLP
jgi:hypothetical protein